MAGLKLPQKASRNSTADAGRFMMACWNRKSAEGMPMFAFMSSEVPCPRLLSAFDSADVPQPTSIILNVLSGLSYSLQALNHGLKVVGTRHIVP